MVHVNCWLMEESRRRVPPLFQEESVQFKRINSASMIAQENRVHNNKTLLCDAFKHRKLCDSAHTTCAAVRKRWREYQNISISVTTLLMNYVLK